MAENPLTGTFEAIWTALKANTTFTTLVVSGNRLEYPVAYEPGDPDTLSNSDTPYVVVVFTGFAMNAHATSSSTLPDLTFEIMTTTSATRSGVVLDVVWAIVNAMFVWHKSITATTSLTYPYIRCVRLLNGEQEIKAAKGVRGWVSVLKLSIGLNIRTSTLETAP